MRDRGHRSHRDRRGHPDRRERRLAVRPRGIASRLGLSSSALPNREDERHASWLELFFDLVFVLALLTLQNRLHIHASPRLMEVLVTAGLFAIVYWAWVGQAFYDTRFDPDDLTHRLAVLVGMVGASAMALGVEAAPETLLLPIGYLVVRASLLGLYLRVRNSGPETRKVTDVYFIGFGVGWLLWAGSLAVPVRVRPVIWLAAMVIELSTPWLGRRWLVRLPVHPSHLPERIGQFTIILLGVSLTDLLTAVPARPSLAVIGAAAVAFVIPASIWWVYTTFVTTGLSLPRLSAGQGYAYVHSVFGAALLLLGWTLGELVGQVEEGTPGVPGMLRLLAALSIGSWMLCGIILQWVSTGFVVPSRVGVSGASIAAVVVTAVFAPNPMVVLLLLAVVMASYAVLVARHIARVGTGRTEKPGGVSGPGD